MANFEIITIDRDSAARRTILQTTHGPVQTPAFMPVGTAGAIKGITPEQIKLCGTDIILANTYHLMLRPGTEVIEKIGGLHKFMSWDKPILTDSGGYQVFSLAEHPIRKGQKPLTKIEDNGVEFTSHVDGTKIYLTPQGAIDIQNRLGADIIMCFDQCTPFPCEHTELEKAVKRTIMWAGLCKKYHTNTKQMLFGIIQGGLISSLRSQCASELIKIDFDGYAIGGLSVGEGHSNMIKTVNHTAALLPENKPRYLMGVGTPADIIAAVKAGVDMFDCVLPTRNGRNASAFTGNGILRLRNSGHKNDKGPIDPDCDCYCCRNFSRAALRHFFNTAEMLGPILVSIHNLAFYQQLMARIRSSIEKNEFEKWSEFHIKKYKDLDTAGL